MRNTMQYVGMANHVRVQKVYDIDGEIFYLFKHQDGRYLWLHEEDLEDEKEAMDFANNFDNNFRGIVGD